MVSALPAGDSNQWALSLEKQLEIMAEAEQCAEAAIEKKKNLINISKVIRVLTFFVLHL